MNGIDRIRGLMHVGSLRFQLLSRSLFVLAALLLLIGVFQYVFMQQFIYRNKAESIQSQILSIPKDTWSELARGKGTQDGPRRPFLFLPDSSLAIVDTTGTITVIFTGRDSDFPPKLPLNAYQKAMQRKKEVDFRIMKDAKGDKQLVVLQPLQQRGQLLGIIQVNTSTKPLKDVLMRQLFTFLSLSMLALIVGMIAFLPVLKRTLIPLFKMVDTVERIDSGNLAERFPERQGQAEIDRLAVSFNGMLERLERSFAAEKEAKEQMRRFIADASHELRTPLTSIHGFLEVLLRGAMNQPEQLRKALISMHGESERINKLVQDLLLLAKLDRTPVMELAAGDLNGVIREMEPQLRLLAGNRSVTFDLDKSANCRFDADKMKQVILNLFHNAVQHTDPDKGDIRIVSKGKPDFAELSVRDNGPGIGADHLPHVFDRFYRSESSRTRKYGGAGLGLSITKSIVEAHGGTISVESCEGKGSLFIARIPTAVG